jgi:hypothetical protein
VAAAEAHDTAPEVLDPAPLQAGDGINPAAVAPVDSASLTAPV